MWLMRQIKTIWKGVVLQALTNLGQHPEITPVNYTCIGTYEDTKNDHIYYMVASDPGAGNFIIY